MEINDSEYKADLGNIVAPLLKWYDENARILPWRENKDPYRVWVSEIMLQQTQVETVIPYYDRFIRQFPDIKSLAEAGEDRLLKLWEGLGYYSRARNLQKAARIIMAKYHGRFPDSYQEILALPGVGEYTAGAISSICFGKPTPAVDGNVLRVIARLTACEEDIARADVKARIAGELGEIYPISRSGDFTQSLMELGATVCLPKGLHKCGSCPLNFLCRAYRSGSQARYPVKSKQKPRKNEQITVLLLRFGDKTAIRRREKGALLGGLWEFPNTPGCLTDEQVSDLLKKWGISPVKIEIGPDKKHVFTHIQWSMSSRIVVCDHAPDKFTWVTKARLETKIALPSAFQSFTSSAFRKKSEG